MAIAAMLNFTGSNIAYQQWCRV